jgi:hypothetical protein
LRRDTKKKFTSATTDQIHDLPRFALDGSYQLESVVCLVKHVCLEWVTLADERGEIGAAFSPDAFALFEEYLLPGAAIHLTGVTPVGGQRMRQLWCTQAPSFLAVTSANVQVIYHE